MVNSPNNLPPEVLQTADDVLLAVRTPRLIHKLAAITKHLPAKGGTTLRMSRYDRLPTAPVPLSPDGMAIPSRVPLEPVNNAPESPSIVLNMQRALVESLVSPLRISP